MSQHKILLIEDEAAIRDMLKFTLSAAEFDVSEAANAEQGWSMILENPPELILLDWMLPGVSGVSLAQRIRQNDKTRTIPIIMLTARGEEDDQVQGFEAGADDYVVKPFSPRALMARIKALLRRQDSELLTGDVLKAGRMRLDLGSHRFSIDDQEVKLGPTEFKLVHYFMTHANRVFTRAQLLDHVWGENIIVEERTVDVHIRRLRKLLEPLGVESYIQTIRGSGYRFAATEA
ncbi:MAG: phosphate regulon transcriptional regulator PhoB [Thiotrichales bacterium]|nr:phosphate regulon transcriptional regulator PhoB [Thiotrichales bacterium]